MIGCNVKGGYTADGKTFRLQFTNADGDAFRIELAKDELRSLRDALTELLATHAREFGGGPS